MTNDHEYGNGVAIFTRDGDAARDFASQSCEIGMVGINVPIPDAARVLHLWRLEAIGFWRPERSTGPTPMRFYTKTKTVTVTLADRHQARRRLRHADALEPVPEKSTDFSDKNTLQRFDTGAILIVRVIPPEREAL